MKTVFITGGSRGIGKAMVEAFTEAGYKVAFTYKSSNEAAIALSKRTGALAVKADSESEAEIGAAVCAVTKELGNIQILINNAGVASFGLLTDMTLEAWNHIFSVNTTAAFLYSKHIIPQMIAKKQGRIINISSVWGITGASCEVAYSASKAALIGFTKALAKELGPSGITVNAIAPGVIETDMNAHLSDDDITALKEETPMVSIGAPDDVANAALFLANDTSSFITGEVINVSGGFLT